MAASYAAARLDRWHQERQQRPSPIAARCYHCQEPLDNPAADFAVPSRNLFSTTALPSVGPDPLHCRSARLVDPREGPQGQPPLPEFAAQSRGLVVRVFLPAAQKPPGERLERDQSPL